MPAKDLQLQFNESNARRLPTFMALCACIALAAAIFARMAGPLDLWNHTQPRTISYTTDIIVHGGLHWILPIEPNGFPATKPPLYNWLAVPMVKILGFGSEFAHKFPSVVALCLTWLIVVRLGRWLDPSSNGMLGWVAGIILPANHAMFKLGYLARPDMLLTLWILLAWLAATSVLVRQRASATHDDSTSRRSHLWIAVFWASIVMAWLTKGPAALAVLAYAIVAARFIGGSWSSLKSLRPVVGLVFTVVAAGTWAFAVWRINPDHFINVLWYDEFYGRVTGLGPTGEHDSPYAWWTTLPYHSFYYITRFLPWSLLTIPAVWLLWHRARHRNRNTDGSSDAQAVACPALDCWMIGATLHIIIVIALFTLSAGKRAEYIAIAIPQASLLAAWLICNLRRWSQRWLLAAPALGAITFAALTVNNQQEPFAPARGFGSEIERFIHDSSDAIAETPLPVYFCWVGDSYVQALLGQTSTDTPEEVLEVFAGKKPYWVIAGRKSSEPSDFADWMRSHRRRAKVTAIVQTDLMPRTDTWFEQLSLFKVEFVNLPKSAASQPATSQPDASQTASPGA